MKTIRLTDEQATLLKMYILLTTKYREGEIETWTSMGFERSKDGALAFPNALSNAEWWTDAHASLAEILTLIDAAREASPTTNRPRKPEHPCRSEER